MIDAAEFPCRGALRHHFIALQSYCAHGIADRALRFHDLSVQLPAVPYISRRIN
ncbi:hypothetical protein [Massilia antarctica]|uniref:hypothetical protein n=1 Tax=Massilia antarctica TaxID=2765360 RepID=UPI00227001B2|nr:hypothetical protein [Massilia sp. H27-R4]MCY0916320.1 hypothetical protein [Massilia sp. H27-R4]